MMLEHHRKPRLTVYRQGSRASGKGGGCLWSIVREDEAVLEFCSRFSGQRPVCYIQLQKTFRACKGCIGFL